MNKDMSDVEKVLEIDDDIEENEEIIEDEIFDPHVSQIKTDIEDIRADIIATTKLITSTLERLENEMQDIIDGVEELDENGKPKKKKLNAYSIADMINRLSDIKLKYHRELMELHKKRKALLEIKISKENDASKSFSTQDLIKMVKKSESEELF